MKPMPAVVAEFDDIADAIAAEARGDAFTPAERFLLRQVPAEARTALDVGCGDGAITRALAARGIAAVGIDASPRMVALARARAGGARRLEYRLGDVMRDAPPPAAYDVVIAVAMVHHVPLAPAVAWLRAAVAPGGTLLIQDVASRPGLRHLGVNALAWLVRRGRRARGRERGRPTVDALYAAHGADEAYLRPSDVAEAYRTLLPGARIHHHLEWRYTVEWRASTGT